MLRKRFPRAFQNVVSNWAGSLASMLIAFFLSPFVVHHLGTTGYGLWILIMSLTGYLGLLDLGVRGSVTRFIARFHTQSRHEEASRLVSSALVIFTLLGGIALVTSIFAGLIAPRLFHAHPKHLELLFILAGSSVASTLISSVFGAVVVGLQRFELSNAVEISVAVVKSLAIVLALSAGKGLLALAIIQLAFSGVTAVTYAWVSWRLYPQLSIRYTLSDKVNARRILSFGSQLFLLNISTYLIFYTDSLVVGAFLPVAMVTLFAIAGNLVNYSRSLLSGVSTTITPLASALEAEGSTKKLEGITLTGSRYATMLVLPIVVTFLLRGKSFIGVWMGPEYAVPSGKVLQVLCLALFFSAASQVTTSMMIGINKHGLLVLMNILEGALNLALSISLVRSMGIAGVAWGTTIPRVVTSLIFWPIYLRRTIAIPPSTYVWAVWVRPIVAAIPFVLASIFVEKNWYAPNVGVFLLQELLTLPVFLVVLWFGCLSRAERHFFLGRPVVTTFGVGEVA